MPQNASFWQVGLLDVVLSEYLDKSHNFTNFLQSNIKQQQPQHYSRLSIGKVLELFQEIFCTHTLFHFLHSLHFQERLSWRWDCPFQDSLVFPVVDETQVKVLWWESEALIRSNGIKYRRKKYLGADSCSLQRPEKKFYLYLLSWRSHNN